MIDDNIILIIDLVMDLPSPIRSSSLIIHKSSGLSLFFGLLWVGLYRTFDVIYVLIAYP